MFPVSVVKGQKLFRSIVDRRQQLQESSGRCFARFLFTVRDSWQCMVDSLSALLGTAVLVESGNSTRNLMPAVFIYMTIDRPPRIQAHFSRQVVDEIFTRTFFIATISHEMGYVHGRSVVLTDTTI